MWTCPQCGREFQKQNQDHYCGDAPETMDDYIIAQPEEVRPVLEKIRAVMRSAAPDAIEKISWRMPTFWQGENIIHFAAFKNHVGVYPGELSRLPFAEKLKAYHTSKGAIQFPYSNPIEYEFIAELTRWRVQQAAQNAAEKAAKKSKQTTGEE